MTEVLTPAEQTDRARLTRPLLAGLSVIAIDAAAASYGAFVLWVSAGPNVVTGSVAGMLLCIAGSTVLMATRIAVVKSLRPAGSVSCILTGLAFSMCVIISYSLWAEESIYYLGWLTTYAALYGLVAGLAVFASSPQSLWLNVALSVSTVVSISALIGTTTVWDWQIVIGCLSLMTLFSTLGFILSAALRLAPSKPENDV